MSENLEQPKIRIQNLPFEEKGRLVDALVWLINQDKKQNPALYKLKPIKQ